MLLIQRNNTPPISLNTLLAFFLLTLKEIKTFDTNERFNGHVTSGYRTLNANDKQTQTLKCRPFQKLQRKRYMTVMFLIHILLFSTDNFRK